jgi:hypothetical protein
VHSQLVIDASPCRRRETPIDVGEKSPASTFASTGQIPRAPPGENRSERDSRWRDSDSSPRRLIVRQIWWTSRRSQSVIHGLPENPIIIFAFVPY